MNTTLHPMVNLKLGARSDAVIASPDVAAYTTGFSEHYPYRQICLCGVKVLYKNQESLQEWRIHERFSHHHDDSSEYFGKIDKVDVEETDDKVIVTVTLLPAEKYPHSDVAVFEFSKEDGQ